MLFLKNIQKLKMGNNLDLDEIAFLDGNIPERIKYYLGGKNK